MATDPDLVIHIDSDISGFTGPITEAQIQVALLDERRAAAGAEAATVEAEAAHLRRAEAVQRIVDLLDGNQTEAARRIGIDQSRVNRLVQKARAADQPPQPPTGPVRWWALDATAGPVADSNAPRFARAVAERAWLTKHGVLRASSAFTWEPEGAGWWLLAHGERTEMHVKWIADSEGVET